MPNTVQRARTVGFALAILALSACSTSPVTSSSTPTPSPTGPPSFDTVVALKDAATSYGFPCPEWQQTNVVDLASQSGSCSDSDVLTVFDSQASHDQQLAQFKQNQQELAAAGIDPNYLLVGPNWIISAGPGDISLLEPNLGGELVRGPAVASDPAESYEPSVDDWHLELKILERKCFGSAGCNITFRIVPSFVGVEPVPETGTLEVTYQVDGGEDGPQINTFEVRGDSAYHDDEERISTASSGDELTVKVTAVEFRRS